MLAFSHLFSSLVALRRPALILALAAGLVGAWASTPSGVTAQTPPALTPRALTLPPTVFGAHVRFHRGPGGNQAADRASGLHTTPLARLGRLSGVLETVTWTKSSSRRRPSHTFSLQYLASIFASPEDAATATADARASLWESGSLLPLPGTGQTAFTVEEKHGREETDITGSSGPIGWEVQLRFDQTADSSSRADARRRLLHAASAARNRIQRLVDTLSPALQAPVTPTPPAIAPAGTGPVIKSPSLMVLAGADAPPGTTLDWGAWRPGTASLAAQAVHTIALAPAAGISRYTRTATMGAAGGLYDAATLYKSPVQAGAALRALATQNNAKSWLHPIGLAALLPASPSLRTVDASAGWQDSTEVIVALQRQNVVMVLVQVGGDITGLMTLAGRLVATAPTWLHAEGARVVDASGTPVTLQGLNWYGFDQQDFVVGGLDYRPYTDILRTIKLSGFNSIRLPFSNQMVEQNPVVTAHLQANPDLYGLHALDIMDRIVQAAGALGLSIILDNHRSDAGWSAEENGLWYTAAYPDSAWVQDWAMLAQRYSVNNTVIGVDLRNEPHGAATWGDGNIATDWQLAAEHGGDAILAANPNLLVIVEGVQFYQNSASYWWGGNLMGVQVAPVLLQFASGSSARSQLVYSAHDYGKANCGDGCPWFNATTSYASLAQLWDQYWGYITADPTKPYAAPVWLGEFGTCNYQANCVSDAAPGSQGQWFSSLMRYIVEHHLGWAYWSANGTESTSPSRVYGDLDWYGFLGRDWSAPLPILQDALHGLQQGITSGG